jgi:tetratricopeptide (TPR) repeat protein
LVLLNRAADYFANARKPRETWKTLADLEPQLNAYDLRCAADDYDTAADVLLEIDFDYLLLWGHYRLMAEMHERLHGKINELILTQNSAGLLGSAYAMIGQTQKAIAYQEQALVITRERRDRQNEGGLLGNLGNRYAELGQTQRAIEFYEQALAIAREIGPTQLERNELGHLGSAYATLGQTRRAIEFYEQALAIHHEIADKRGEGVDLGNLAECLVDLEYYDLAMERATEGIRIGEEVSSPNLGNHNNRDLALAHLYAGNLPAARAPAESARKYDEPLNNHNVLALLGIIALRQNDRAAAQEAFTAAIAHADTLLAQTPQYYDALDAKGVALCGSGVV